MADLDRDTGAPHFADDLVTLHHGDCIDVLAGMADHSVDAVVTDPPYGLGFMGKEWDSGKSFVERKPARRNGFDHVGGNHNPTDSDDAARTRRVEAQRFGAWCELWAVECLRVLKPGGHLLAFGGTRTWHRLTCAIEDAGFEVRDSIAWLYGSGFPKSLDVSKAIDKAAGAEREVVGEYRMPADSTAPGYQPSQGLGYGSSSASGVGRPITAAATPDAERWQGWGTALKPAHEPIVVARKPLAGTVAANVTTHGTGALNIDGCRVEGTPRTTHAAGNRRTSTKGSTLREGLGLHDDPWPAPEGRWPTNVVLSDDQAAELDQQTGVLTSGANPTRRGSDKFRDAYGDFRGQEDCTPARGADSGGASRFFPTFRYEAKAPTDERPRDGDVAHPTVKPLDLMRWLVRLVTPPAGTVLDPFAGSGTTAEACVIEGFRCIAIEKHAPYLPLIVARLTKPIQPDIFGAAS